MSSASFKDVNLSSFREISVYKNGTASLQNIRNFSSDKNSQQSIVFINKNFSFQNIELIFSKSNSLLLKNSVMLSKCDAIKNPSLTRSFVPLENFIFQDKQEWNTMLNGSAYSYINSLWELKLILIPSELKENCFLFPMEVDTKGGYLLSIQSILDIVGGIPNRKKYADGHLWFDGSISSSNIQLVLKKQPKVALAFIQDLLENKQNRLNYDVYSDLFIKFWLENSSQSSINWFKIFSIYNPKNPKLVIKLLGTCSPLTEHIIKTISNLQYIIVDRSITGICLSSKFYNLATIKRNNKIKLVNKKSLKYSITQNKIQKRKVHNITILIEFLMDFCKINNYPKSVTYDLLELLKVQPAGKTIIYSNFEGLLKPRPISLSETRPAWLTKDWQSVNLAQEGFIKKNNLSLHFSSDFQKKSILLDKEISLKSDKVFDRRIIPFFPNEELNKSLSTINSLAEIALEESSTHTSSQFYKIIINREAPSVGLARGSILPEEVVLTGEYMQSHFPSISGLSNNLAEIANIAKNDILVGKPSTGLEDWNIFTKSYNMKLLDITHEMTSIELMPQLPSLEEEFRKAQSLYNIIYNK